MLFKVVSNFKKSNLWESGSVQLTRYADVVFKQYFDWLVSQYKVTNIVRSQEILCQLMFDARGKNVGMAKFIRGFRRLLTIMRFAKLIGDDFDPHVVDIGAYTLFHVRTRQLRF